MIRILLLLLAFATFVQSQECNVQIATSGPVCVCNSTYCDTVPALNVSSGYYQFYSTSQSKLGFYSTTGPIITNTTAPPNIITVNQATTYQTIIGFGGAFTDSAGINIASLPAAAQQKLLESYFSESGIGYNLCRVPVGGTDFSTRAYSYDDNFDPLLLNFQLQPEDFNYKIPYIQQAINLTNNGLKLFATAWTAPPWMKTNNSWSGLAILQPQYYQLWADYYIKFFDAYLENGIPFWGMTTQNEPINGFIPAAISPLNAMGWTPDAFNAWIGLNLGPTLRTSVHKDVKIILHDDQRTLLILALGMLYDPITMMYAEGVGVHWYTDTTTPASTLSTVKSPFRDVFILSTEACNGFLALTGLEPSVDKGSWDRGAKYLVDIFEDLQNGVAGWVDWNMVLDETGGPNYISNFVDSPILVNATLGEFYKQPMFYALGHFSKFVIPGSVRVETTLSLSLSVSGVQALAFLRPDNLTAVVIFNNGNSNVSIQIQDINNQIANLDIETYSINTLLFK